MNTTALKPDTPAQDLILDEVFPHTVDLIWKTLTSGDLISRWLMEPKGFAPVKDNHFYFQTPPDGDWDGKIRCQIVEIIPNQRLVYTWCSGHDSPAGYVKRLDTLVAWTLTPVNEGTRLRLVHSGFVVPKNEGIMRNIATGWPKCLDKLQLLLNEEAL